MKKAITDKPVTESKAKRIAHDAIKEFSEEVFKPTIKRLDDKIDRVAYALVKTQDDVTEIKNAMATKQDVALILDRIDSYVGKAKVMDQEQAVQALHIKELKDTTRQHESRITALESLRPAQGS